VSADRGPQPDAAYFALMAEVAETHWWYVGRRAILADLLRGRVPAGGTAVDVGCGTGEVLHLLAGMGATTAAGTDLSPDALAVARERGGRVLRSVAETLPFRSASADVLVSLEVIEHLDDDVRALREYVRVAKPGATVVVTVPAYAWLFSEHDVRAAHRRRYSRTALQTAVEAAGLEIERTTGYYAFLVPLAAVLRKTPLRRLFPATDEEVSSMPVVDTVFRLLAGLERRWLRRRDLAVGLSFAVVARVPQDGGSRTR
jgi:ubiquinone/menaquinone biosynthesis C-methylase UbiE